MDNNTSIRDYNNSTIKPDYAPGIIRKLLEAYNSMEGGKMPLSRNIESQIAKGVPVSDIIGQNMHDLSLGFKTLTDLEMLVLLCIYICGYTPQEIGSKFRENTSSLDVAYIEDSAICKMCSRLNNGISKKLTNKKQGI